MHWMGEDKVMFSTSSDPKARILVTKEEVLRDPPQRAPTKSV